MKKALALILSLMMVLALIPVSAAEGASATLMTELPASGDRVVIHNTANNKALDACGTSGYYNAGADIVPADGSVTGVSENIVWDVSKNEDGSYRFSQNGKFLSMGDSYSSTPYDDVNKDWTIEAHGDGYSIKNVKREVYLEWFAAKNYFSGYAKIDDSGAFDFLFYKVEGEVIADPTATPDGSGIVTPGTKVTLACATANAEIYWKIDDGAFAAYTEPVTINETCTLFAYAQVGESTSNTVQYTYTVKTSDIMSIKEALEAGDVASATVVGQLVYRFGNYASINSAILQAKIDGEVYALQCYNSLESYSDGNAIEIGDWIVLEKGKLSKYGGVQQIQSAQTVRKAEEAEIIGEDASAPQEFNSFADITANHANLLSEYVVIKNVTLGAYNDNGSTTVTDSSGTTTMPIYRAYPYPAGVEAGDVVDLYVIVSQYNSTKQFRSGLPMNYRPTSDTKAPVIERVNNIEAEVGKAYTFAVTVEDASGVANVKMEVFNGTAALDVFDNVPLKDGVYSIVIPATSITGGNLTVKVTATDAWETPNTAEASFEITV
ncbi:MAG: chitobiase/beta-hexosaminidase C-terminal domain-containing protein, partial [Clostridia bacterium]|nr:chitobiase/beta-hexosaminidase C-terminal domain-containing protein [Clostridia bacterium]